MAKRSPDYFPKHINQYVPAMTYAADAVENGPVIIDLETPDVADADYFLADSSISASTAAIAATSITLTNNKVTQKYGVNVAFFTSTASPARTMTVTGRDYLGQVMTEALDLTTLTDATSGVKAFKWVDSIAFSSATGVTAASVWVGTGSKQGLPYRTVKHYLELSDAAGNASPSVTYTTGVLVVGMDADEDSTATTADVRGTYTPYITLNGTATLLVQCVVDRNNLHGNEQA